MPSDLTPSAEKPIVVSEDDVPLAEIGTTIEELVELYGGEMERVEEGSRTFVLPLRRGVSAGGAIHCAVTWDHGTDRGSVTLRCDRDVDAPRFQRMFLLVAGVIGALLFTIWPFFPHRPEFGVLAWVGGAVALSVYLMTLRRTSGGIAADFLRRLAKRQRDMELGDDVSA